MTLTLRPYQTEAIAAVKRAWGTVNATMLVAATGLGKTVIFNSLLAEVLTPGKRGLILAHRRELITQSLTRLEQHDPALALRTGIVMANSNQVASDLIVATIQTLASEKRLRQVLAHGKIDYLITDECFPAGTLIDGKPIETIHIGETVTAWDETQARLTSGRVTRLYKRLAPAHLIRITAQGITITCTPEHPILCNGKWTPARNIQLGDYLSHEQDHSTTMRRMRHSLFATQLEFHHDPGLLGSLQSNSACRKTEGCLPALPPMRKDRRVQRQTSPGFSSQGQGLLLGRVQNTLFETALLGNSQRHQSPLCQRTHETAQPDEQSERQSQDAKEAQGQGVGEWGAGRQRRDHRATSAACACIRLGNRSSYSNGQSQGKRVSILLQSGHRQPCPQNRRRSGWAIAQTARASVGRSEKDRFVRSVRVESVEVLERGSDGRFEHLCPDGYVYNLEVAHYHTYLANGVIVHNCHHATAKAYTNLYETLQQVNPALKHLGVTATPIRADGDGLSKTYQSVAAKYDIGWGIKNGYLAPVRWLEVKTGISLKGIRSQAGDFSARQLADVFETSNCFDLVVHTHQQYGADRPFLAYTVSVEGAHTLAAKFNAAGIPVGSADASTPDDTRKQLIRQLERGELRGLINMGLWTEGLDIPQVSLIHQVRPTQSDGLYVQIIGRALRTHPGKADALILDYAPKDARNIAMFGDILGVPLDKKEYSARETQEAEEAEGPIQAGFTFDGEYRFLNGDPMEIVVRELNYLEQSPWSWHRTPDGWLTLGLGKAADQIERTLVMRPPQNGHDEYTLYGVAKRPVQFDHEGQPVRWSNEQAHYLKSAPFEELHALAEAYANKHGSAVLAGKQRGWRNEPPSMGQIQYARRLGIFQPGLSKGELANRITMHLAVRAVERGL